MLYSITIFILFLGPLVFFHELGHFLFARLFGVRVEVFSIGFGPKLMRKKWGDTEYAFSLIPLGGYVKMFGDDPLGKDDIAEEDIQYSFTHKSKWARFWIVFGGPFANFIFSIFIFFWLSILGETVPEIRFGVLPEKSILYEKGVMPGDVLKEVNGVKILSPTDFPMEGDPIVHDIVVSRLGKEVIVPINIDIFKFFKIFSKYPPFLRSAVVVDEKGERWGLSLSKDKIDWTFSVDEIANLTTPSSIYLFKLIGNSDKKGLYKYDKHQYKEIAYEGGDRKLFFTMLHNHKYWPVDLQIKSVKMKSPADKAQLLLGDIILSLDNKKMNSFEDLRFTLQKIESENVDVEILRNGEVMPFTITPDIKKNGEQVVKLIGVYSSGEFLPGKFIQVKSKGLVGSLIAGFTRSWDAVLKTAKGFLKLITNQVSLKAVGGPLSIGKVAADSFDTSLSYFFQIMALISVNLGVINLFPIPVLDGGHILFLILEFFNKGPLSRRKMEIAQQFGLSLLLLLMVVALFNDFTRFFYN